MGKNARRPDNLIPMRELEKLTNLSRATINYYIKEGLLPLPEKSAKNMAYYDEDFVEKLKFIEKMREADFTLNQIRRLVNYDADTVNGFGMQVMESVDKLLPTGYDEAPVTLEQLKAVGFSDDDMRKFLEMRIVNPVEPASTLFPAYTLTICRLIRYFHDFGIPLSESQAVLQKIKELADIEKDIFIRYIRSPMLDGNVSPEAQRAEIERCIESINGLLPILHLKFLKLPNEDFRHEKTDLKDKDSLEEARDRRKEAEEKRKETEEKRKEEEDQKREREAQKREKEAQKKKEEAQEKEERAREREEKQREREAEAREKEAEKKKKREK